MMLGLQKAREVGVGQFTGLVSVPHSTAQHSTAQRSKLLSAPLLRHCKHNHVSHLLQDVSCKQLRLFIAFLCVQDGVALVDSKGVVVDFVSYEGQLTAADGPAKGQTAKALKVQQSSSTPVGRSLGLTGKGGSRDQFIWADMRASPGTSNEGQTFESNGECSATDSC